MLVNCDGRFVKLYFLDRVVFCLFRFLICFIVDFFLSFLFFVLKDGEELFKRCFNILCLFLFFLVNFLFK